MYSLLSNRLFISFRHILLLIGFFVFLATILTNVGSAQSSSSNSSSNSNTAATPSPTATPIPIGSIVSELDKTSTSISEAKDFLAGQKLSQTITDGIPLLPTEIQELETSTKTELAGRVTLESVRTLESGWQSLQGKVENWTKSVQTQISNIDKRIVDLEAMRSKWRSSLAAISQNPDTSNVDPNADGDSSEVVPPEVLSRINEVVREIENTIKTAGDKRAELLTIESRLSESQSKIEANLKDIKAKRETLLTNIFRRDDSAIWSGDWASVTPANLFSQLNTTLRTQSDAFWVYFAQNPQRFIFHGFFLFAMFLLMIWVKKKTSPIAIEEPKLSKQASFFNMPIASALVVSAVFAGVIYPQMPQLLVTIIGIALVIPGILLLRQTIEKPLNILLYGVLAFYLTDRVRDIVQDPAFANRLLFAAEMLAAGVFLLWFYRSKYVLSLVEAGTFKTYSFIKSAIPITAAAFGLSFVAGLFGFVSLSYLIGNGVLRTVYSALILYTIVQILSAAVAFALRMRPLSLLGSVKNNRSFIRQKITRYIGWLFFIFWVLIVLNVFSLQDSVYEFLGWLFTYAIKIGEISFTFGDIILFLLTVWAAMQISKLIRFLLEEDVFPRIGISGGVSFSISSVIHYLILILGFMIAIAAVGIELSKFAVVLGAIGVGIGFGLQTIVNNFISGLILLFERPVKVGDTIELNGQIGKLRKIGLRASILRKVDGSEVIVPNSQLMSDEVVNWSGTDDTRRVDIPIGVAYGTDPHKVLEILDSIPRKFDLVLADPPTRALFSSFGENSLDFELRFWVNDDSSWVPLRSEIIMAIHDEFVEAGIEMPFPQRDLHIRSMDPEVANDLLAINKAKENDKEQK